MTNKVLLEHIVDPADSMRIRTHLGDYLLELSQFAPAGEAEAVLEYPYLDHYWREPDRFPFVITHNGADCGFALIRRVNSGDVTPDYHTIAEFFIQPAYRRLGCGDVAVTKILRCFPGDWLVQVMELNQPAYHFWAKTLNGVTASQLNPQLKDGYFDFTFDFGVDSPMA